MDHPVVLVIGSIARSASLPVFSLLRGRFWGLSPRRGDTLHRWGWNLAEGPLIHEKFHPHWCNDKGAGPPKLKFLLRFDQMWNINAPQGRIPCAIFTKFAQFVRHFRMRWVLKFGWICSRGYGVMGVLSWGGGVSPKFSAPPRGETMHQTPKRFRGTRTCSRLGKT